MKKLLLLSLFITSLAVANELEKEIKYLGNNGSEESHEVICINGKSGIVTIDNTSQEMTVKTGGSSFGKNIGRATFTQASKIICK